MLKMSRLPGRSVKNFGWAFQRHQLWLASEYLLHREISGYREEVKRYYYGDIQAIVWGPTGSWWTCNVVVGSLFVLSIGLLILLSTSGAPNGLLILAYIFGGVTAGTLMMNLILGPTCKTVLYTATSEAPLYSLGRQRATEKAIARILPFIEAAQGTISPIPPAENFSPTPEPVAEAANSAGEELAP